MPTRIDARTFTVTVDGTDISDDVLSLRLRFGFDLRVSEAEVTIRQYPVSASIDYWKALVIDCGRVGTGCTGSYRRFDGYVYDLDYSLWPYAVKIIGRGPLVLAQRVKVPEDDEADGTTSLTAEYEAPGIDMSLNPDTEAEWTDAEMVTWVLGKCGLAGRLGQIGGVGRLLGSYAFDQFVWRRGQSGLEFLESLDQIALGQRTFERLGGQIVRAQTGFFAPFSQVEATFNEGADLLEGATLNRSAKDARNRVVVQGWDDGGGAMLAVETAGHPAPPPGVAWETEFLSSPLIELDEPAIDGYGLSCREVAQWLIGEVSHTWIEATFPTWRDDPVSPGDVVYLNSPHLGPNNQSMWVKHVEVEIDERGAFTQTLTLRAPAYWPGPGVAALAASLPVGLG